MATTYCDWPLSFVFPIEWPLFERRSEPVVLGPPVVFVVLLAGAAILLVGVELLLFADWQGHELAVRLVLLAERPGLQLGFAVSRVRWRRVAARLFVGSSYLSCCCC